MNVLGIETSCDETSAAVYAARPDGAGDLKSNVVASQVDLHARFGGVVPELSARAHVERLPAIVAEALSRAGCAFCDVDAVAVTSRPGLLSALLAGVSYARGLAIALDRPVYAVDHVKAHVAAAFLPASPETPEFQPLAPGDLPALAMVASGGHTVLLKMNGPTAFDVLGTTRDDAVGEAFDKVGHLLGLPFPGGPEIERAAAGGDPDAFSFPIGVIRGHPLDFSFSGLKTAVLYAMAKLPARARRRRVADLAASFQKAAIAALVRRAVAAGRETQIRAFVLCGGVAANHALRAAMSAALATEGARLTVPPVRYCGDTAAQVARFAAFQIAEGAPPADPGLDACATSELFALQ